MKNPVNLKRLRKRILALMAALALIPLSVLAVTENTMEAAPEEIPVFTAAETESREAYLPYYARSEHPERDELDDLQKQEEAAARPADHREPCLSREERLRLEELLKDPDIEERIRTAFPVANKEDFVSVGVYPLNPDDYDGESFYVILPDQPLKDDQLLSLLAAFRQLEIPFDPNALNSRNCVRDGSWKQTRYITTEEQVRYDAICFEIHTGLLTAENVSPDASKRTVVRYTVSDGRSEFRFYPYRRMTDDELALYALETETVWDYDPADVERKAREYAASALRLPLYMSVAENGQRYEVSQSGSRTEVQYVNWFNVEIDGASALLIVRQYEGRDGELLPDGLELEGPGSTVPDGFRDNDFPESGEEQWFAAADAWVRDHVLLSTDSLSGWKVLDRYTRSEGSDLVILEAETPGWFVDVVLYPNSLRIALCDLWYKRSGS